MSIIRLGIVLVVAVALLPSDPNARSELAVKAAHVGQETATFCERNPHTCGAGQELWAAFIHKAQYGLTLAAEFARNYADRAAVTQAPVHGGQGRSDTPASYDNSFVPGNYTRTAPATPRPATVPAETVPSAPEWRPPWRQSGQSRERI